MAAPSVAFQAQAGKSHAAPHPFNPLSTTEIVAASGIIRSLYPANAILQFKAVTLQEPEKELMLPYLEAEHAGKTLPTGLARKAFVAYYLKNTVSYES